MPFFDPIRIGAAGAADSAYTVSRSFRFNDNDSTYLQRSPSSNTSGSTQKITISFWIKLGNIPSGTNGGTFFGTAGDSHRGQFFNQTLYFQYGSNNWINTTGVFRDPTAWYHVIYAVDTTQSTTSDRQKIYVNGVLQGRGNTISDPSQNAYIEFFNNSSETYYIGRRQSGNYFDGYLAEINFLDGYAYDASYFGETNADTGQWVPKKYTGSYGTNGFYLDFSDNSSITNMCLDASGNGNNFSPDNCNTEDSMIDTPTNNFAVMNPLTNYSGLSQGNLRFNFYNDSAGNRSVQATIALPKSGKWYWEARYQEAGTGTTTTKYFGVSQAQMNTGYLTAPYVYYDTTHIKNGNSSEDITHGNAWYNGVGVPAILAIAVDVDNNSVKFYKDNSLQGTITLPTLTAEQEYFFTWANTSGGSSSSLNDTFNFGADSTFQGQVTRGGNTDANGIGDFKYAPPSGHLALCTANLPTPTILLPNKHFGTLIWTGNSTANRTVSDTSIVNFTPDWVWVKCRSAGHDHQVTDSVRGSSIALRMNSDGTEEDWDTLYSGNNKGMGDYVNGGFVLDDNGNNARYNANSQTYVAWNWNGGDAASKTYKVKVVSDSTDYGHGTGSNKYQFLKSDGSTGFGTNGVDLDLEEGGTYIFDWSDSSAQLHPIRFSLTNDGTHSNGTSAGTEYTTGVTKDDSAYKTTITIASGVANLFYYCQNHSGMGAEINTNATKGSSDFEGNTQATVKVNATAGFSIISWNARGTSSGTYDTVGHGLGVRPDWLILKARNSTGNWNVYNSNFSSANDKILQLSNSIAETTSSNYWGADNTTPSSTLIHLNQGNYANSASPAKFIMYAFSEVAGYSKFGTYTGNGSSDGTFVHTGFRPAFVMIKCVSASDHWNISDAERGDFNEIDEALYANNEQTEGWNGSLDKIDYLSNGFKPRANNSQTNGNGSTYIYFAFAESPFKNARAR